MENLGAKSVCFLEQLRPSLHAWTVVTYKCFGLYMVMVASTVA
jgi:hypothetical protein